MVDDPDVIFVEQHWHMLLGYLGNRVGGSRGGTRTE